MTLDIATAYEQERDTLLHDLAHLHEDQWSGPNLCAGWDVLDVAAHLLMPYELGVASLVGRMFTARFNFDRLALRWAVNDRRTPAELLRALAATSAAAFNVPGAGPLTISTPISPEAARPVPDDITGGKHAAPAALLTGLRWEATDAEWNFGHGLQIPGCVALAAGVQRCRAYCSAPKISYDSAAI